MKGYLRVASVMPQIKVGDVKFNLESIKEGFLKASSFGAKICVFPRLCITGNNLGDMYYDGTLLNNVIDAITNIIAFSQDIDSLLVISLPYMFHNKLYEVAAVIKSGKVLCLIPNNNKNNIFDIYNDNEIEIEIFDKLLNIRHKTIIANDVILNCDNLKISLTFDCNFNIKKSSNMYLNLSSIPETIDYDNIITKIKLYSLENNVAVITSSSGSTESTSQNVYFGRASILEAGKVLAKNDILNNEMIIADIDIDIINSYNNLLINNKSINIYYNYNNIMQYSFGEKLYREFNKYPYINLLNNPYRYSMHIINMLAVALSKRFISSHSEKFVIGISGGLDSTMALIIICKTVELLGIDNSSIVAISMPGFGTTTTSSNYINELCNSLGVSYKLIDIKDSVNLHFTNISHDINNSNSTFENAQARERMQILMDVANDVNGIVVGTGDLSEIALGFSTYNGDQMSMYNINASLPKTLIKYILNSIADENIKNNDNQDLANVLKNILHMPISPELMPTENGVLIQKTEEILGNYEIHDFILFYYLKYHFDIEKLFDMALRTFVYCREKTIYSEEYIRNCVNIFFDRFFKNQFKRAAAPDSPYIGLPNLNSHYYFNIPCDIEVKYSI